MYSKKLYTGKYHLYASAFAIVFYINISICAAVESKSFVISPEYMCNKVVKNAICIDGNLKEKCWETAPVMKFLDLVDGSEHQIRSFAKILWDDKYIYIAYEIHDPNVVAYYGTRKRGGTHINSSGKQNTGEPEIMFQDTFIKFFLDPDADGKNYLEIHINPINNVSDLLLDLPYLYSYRPSSGGIASRKALHLPMIKSHPDWYWNCKGLKSAVQVHGTLNYSEDKDDGWTVELAIPWDSLYPLSKGAYCPSKGRNKWRAHLGYVYKPEFNYEKRRRSRHIYSTWPVIGIHNCHLPERWGYLNFTSKAADTEKGENSE